MNCNVDDFAEVGIGYSLYFKTLIYLMKYMAIQSVIITIYMMMMIVTVLLRKMIMILAP